MAFAKLQNGTDNKQLGTGGMTGGAAPGQTGGTAGASGQPSGFTNIQDYMGANAGDKTNQNYLNTTADKQIGGKEQSLNSNIASLTAINQNPAASQSGLSDILNKNDYTTAKNYASTPTFTPTANELPDTYSGENDPTQKLQGTLTSVMDYMGGVKPVSQSYTPGMAKFDEMLLAGDKQFPGQFAENKKADYKTKVADKYSSAVTGREGEKKQATDTTNAWRTQMSDYLGGRKGDIANTIAQQQAQAVTGNPDWYDRGASGLVNQIRELDPEYAKNAFVAPGSEPGNMRSTDLYLDLLANPNNYWETIAPNASQDTALTALNAGNAGDFSNDYNALAGILGQDSLNYQPTEFDKGGFSLRNLPGYSGNRRF